MCISSRVFKLYNTYFDSNIHVMDSQKQVRPFRDFSNILIAHKFASTQDCNYQLSMNKVTKNPI